MNGDGAAELVGKDDSFDYAFAPTPDPARLRKSETGWQSHHGRVSNRGVPQTARPNAAGDQGLASPGIGDRMAFLPVGSRTTHGRERRRSLAQNARIFDRNSDWDLSVCTIATKDFDPCPEYAKRKRDFPTALREHLAKNGYSLEGIAPRRHHREPQFRLQQGPDTERDRDLPISTAAELDNILAAGYAFIKSTRGRPTADESEFPIGSWSPMRRRRGLHRSSVYRGDIRPGVRGRARIIAGLGVGLFGSSPATTDQSPPPAPAVAIGTDEPKPPPHRTTKALPEPASSLHRTAPWSRTHTWSRTARTSASRPTRA